MAKKIIACLFRGTQYFCTLVGFLLWILFGAFSSPKQLDLCTEIAHRLATLAIISKSKKDVFFYLKLNLDLFNMLYFI